MPSMRETPDLNDLYGAESLEDLRGHYDAWAERYEADSLRFGRMAPPVAAGYVGRHTPLGTRGPVMDIGCGTGVMGDILTVLGLGPLDGVDLSPGMLTVAARKGVYRNLLEAAVGPDKLRAQPGSYALTIAVGVFTLGHAGPEALDEMVRLTRPGGLVVFSATLPVLDDGFHAKIQALSDRDRWRMVEATAPFTALRNVPEAPSARVFAYRVG